MWQHHFGNQVKRVSLLIFFGMFLTFVSFGFSFNPLGQPPQQKCDNLQTSSQGQDESRIPQHIWQIFFSPSGGDKRDQLRYMSKWATMAPNYTYTLLSDPGGSSFVLNNFDTDVSAIYQLLRNPALKSDFLRYLLLYVHGGYYSDLDTRPVKHLKDWIPSELRPKARLVVAPEHDDGIYPNGEWQYPMQFCQWTIAAAPGHPALKRMIARAVVGLKDLAASQSVSIDRIRASDRQVWNATGPPAWTEMIFDAIKDADPQVTSLWNLSRLAEPKLFGDILLLPIDSFMTLSKEYKVLPGAGSHQLVHHDFAGAWKES